MIMTFLVWFFGIHFSQLSEARISQWQETCPAGYVLVPKNNDYVPYNFCVMKYEAKALTTAGTVDLDGCNEAGCTTGNWGTLSHSPTSVADGLPWRMVSYDTALAECRSLGNNYNLITNAQWQTVARNLELVSANWTTGSLGTGCMFTGNANDLTCGYNGANPEGGTGRNTRARLFLSNGQEVWDFSGNMTEWVADPNTFHYGPEAMMAGVTLVTHATTGILDDQVSRASKEQFGPSGTYSGCNNAGNDYCGIGNGWLSPANGAISRGGNYNDTFYAGVFMSYLLNGTGGSGSVNTGFRCTYLPNDPCINSGIIAPGTRCHGGQLFVGTLRGYDYFTTPSGCTNSANPTCAGGIDTTFKEWMGTTGSNVDIAAVPNIASASTPSSEWLSGADLTPIIAADASVSSDSYADYCNDMNFSGKSDWFQPNKTEHAYLYCKSTGANHNPIYPEEAPDCYTFGGRVSALSGFGTTDGYPSAEEVTFNSHRDQDFFSGRQNSDQKTNGGFARCMRREISRDICAGSPSTGATCRGGAIYAGTFDDGHYMVTPGGCGDSPFPICDGSTDSVTKAWRGSTGSNTDIPGVTNIASDATPSSSTQRGYVVGPIIAANASISSDSAADYCRDMVFGNYSDWYLPSKSELQYLYCNSDARSTYNPSYPNENPNCASTGVKTALLTGFANQSYHSSSEKDLDESYAQSFSDGSQSAVLKSQSLRVRCVRRFRDQVTVILSSGTSWVVPAGVTSLKSIEVWGGGGGAAGRTGGYSEGGGGGGAYSRKENYSVTPGQLIPLQVGTGGVSQANANGGAGSDTWFDGTGILLAKGGGGGVRLTYLGGVGGSSGAGVGDVLYSGGNGGDAVSGFGGGGGGASGSIFGDGSTGLSSSNNNGVNGGTALSGGTAGVGGLGGLAPGTGGSGEAHLIGGGGGGGGGANTTPGGAGGAAGGAGGFPGGGAGGPGANINGAQNSSTSLNGANGQIVIRYFP